MDYELKKIDLWSAIKISFMVNAVIGLVIGLLIGFVFAFIVSFVSQMVPADGPDMASIPFGPLGGFFIGLIYALFIAVVNGIIVTSVIVIMYNLFAGWVGGLKLEFQPVAPELIAPTMTIAGSEQTGKPADNV
jgi:predicted membrane-bound spermidine synthase